MLAVRGHDESLDEMRFRRTPSAGSYPTGGNTHGVDDKLAVLGVTNRVTGARRRPAAQVWMLPPVHVDVTDAAALRREDDFVLADHEVNRPGVRIDAERSAAAERARRARFLDDDVRLAGLMWLVVRVRRSARRACSAAARLDVGGRLRRHRRGRELGREASKIARAVRVRANPITFEPFESL